MTSDIHLSFERRVYIPDEATKRTRLIALMLAKRRSLQANKAGDCERAVLIPDIWDFPPELWLRIANICPVSYDIVWLQCPFAEWLSVPGQNFNATFNAFVLRAEAIAAELQTKNPANGNVVSCLRLSEEILQRLRQDPPLTPIIEKYRSLEYQNQIKFGLFSGEMAVYRSKANMIRQLGCVREGWPADQATQFTFPLGWSTDDEWEVCCSHSRCFCTLEGLFAVDWDVCCSSEEHSGRHMRPKGAVKCLHPELVKASGMELLKRFPDKREEVVQSVKARIAEMTLEQGAENREGVRRYYELLWEMDAPLTKPRVLPTKTRREIANNPNFVGQLHAIEATLAEAGNDPADFRVLIDFFN